MGSVVLAELADLLALAILAGLVDLHERLAPPDLLAFLLVSEGLDLEPFLELDGLFHGG